MEGSQLIFRMGIFESASKSIHQFSQAMTEFWFVVQ